MKTASATTSATSPNLAKMRAHYPDWDITVSLEETIRQIVENWRKR